MLPPDPLLRATAPAGPHLPTATLRQYAAGTLSAATQHRVEAHTLACPRCADILEGLLQTPPTTTDQALHQLQQRLRLRVQQAETARPALRRASHRWLVPQLAAAATLLFGLLAGGWYTWQQRHATPAGRPVAATSAPATAVPAAPTTPAAPAASGTSAATVAANYSRLAEPAGRPGQPLAARQRSVRPAGAAPGRRPATAPATALAKADDSVASRTWATAAPVAAAPRPAGAAPRLAGADTTAANEQMADQALSEVVVSSAPARKAAPPDAGRSRLALMPNAPAVPPTPAGGYPAWREKIRHAAAEFKPEEGEPPLSGTVQLRVLIGADGKVQEIRVRHGLRDDYDEEAQRLVCEGPAWVPGIGGGRRAAQFVDVAVPF